MGSPASARRHPRTAPCQEGTAEEPGGDNAVLQGPFICFTPHVLLSVPKALGADTGELWLRDPVPCRQRGASLGHPGSPGPGSPRGLRALALAGQDVRPDGCRQGQDTQLSVEPQGHSGNLHVAVTAPGPTPNPPRALPKEVSVPARGAASGTGRATRAPRAAGNSALGLHTQPGALLGTGQGDLQPKEAPELPLRCWKSRQQAHTEPCTDGCGTRGPCQPHAMSFDGCANKSGARWSPPRAPALESCAPSQPRPWPGVLQRCRPARAVCTMLLLLGFSWYHGIRVVWVGTDF